MQIHLKVIDGPHQGQEFTFGRHDTFLVGRSRHAHFQLPIKDKYVSRIHFMVEVNPPQCRLVDMGSHNGTFVNGQPALAVDLKDGDQIRAGRTTFKLQLERELTDSDIVVPRPSEAHASAADRVPGCLLDGKIRSDSLGTVHHAKRKADGLIVSVRTLIPDAPGSPEQVEAFLAEARTLLELDHPGIVRLLDLGHAEGLLYFVMRGATGSDAEALLKALGPFSEERTVHILDRILEALHYAHEKKIVHRGLRPSNVLIGARGGKETIQLMDFGLARLYQASPLSGLSLTEDIAAYAPYLPPEVITNHQNASPVSDQYAAAATAYTLLTGQPVYDFPDETHLQYSLLLQQQPVPIRQRRPDVSDALAGVLHRALQRNPANRYRDVSTFRQALRRAAK